MAIFSSFRRTGYILPIVAFVCLASGLLQANPVTCRTGLGCLNGTDSFDWGIDYGLTFSAIPNSSTVSSLSLAETDTVSFAGGNGERRDQNNGWAGNFTPGDALLWTDNNGPLTFNFNKPLGGLGANIQADFFGAFIAKLDVFGTSGLIESVIEAGNSTSAADGSAIFIGVANDSGITSATFSLTSASNDPNDFAINQLDISPNTVPEPTSLLLFGSALVGVAAFGRKRFAKTLGR